MTKRPDIATHIVDVFLFDGILTIQNLFFEFFQNLSSQIKERSGCELFTFLKEDLLFELLKIKQIEQIFGYDALIEEDQDLILLKN